MAKTDKPRDDKTDAAKPPAGLPTAFLYYYPHPSDAATVCARTATPAEFPDGPPEHGPGKPGCWGLFDER